MTIRCAIAAVVVAMLVACGSSHETIDASGPSKRDAGTPTGELGDDCTGHGDCVSGYCVEAIGGVGGVCTRTCNNDCPPDWNCRDVQQGETSTKLCIPNAPQLCLSCANDLECGSDAACLQIDGGGSCATKCTTACPTGYTCAADATGAHSGTYCQPVIGSCSCSAAMEGASRACTTENAIGTCYGTETCAAATGWSACSAKNASVETCDGVDNDCDFLIDEDVGGGEACTNMVAGVGSCPGTRTCVGAAGFSCQGQIPALETCNYADDDCDSTADEAFPTLSTLCSPGVGACQRFGSIRCTPSGTGVECSVVAGTPGTELCNQLDDDCDTKTDETFSTLGTSCSVGLGVCTRYGTTTCSSDATMTTCSATAGPPTGSETCNYLDDNCDGTVDDTFRNVLTGAYDTTANCGACGNDCDAVFTGQSSSGACNTGGASPQCVMVCDPGTSNLNNSTLDGCEFTLDATTIYVSISEAAAIDDATCGLGPTGTGAGNHPCRTIGMGMTRAAALGRANVRVADGSYDEAVALVSNRNLLGGYRPGTWERHLATTNTVIQGVTSTGNHDSTVTAINVTAATFEGFAVRGAFNTKSGGNSYAIYVSGGSASLTIRSNQIFAGRGGPGAAGSPGSNGTTGTNGAGSVSGSYDSFIATGSGACATTNNRQIANGGVLSCGGNNVSGGNGGGNRCSPMINMQFSGINGFAGNAGAGAGGGAAGGIAQAGFDGELEIQGQSSTCYVPPQSQLGSDGASGQPGAHGASVAGCTASGGSIVAGHWQNGSAVGGTSGSNGGGAGGGGAGGGAHCTGCGPNGKDRLGAHGGGGGSGGCGGVGGGAGGAGGAVFGIFIVGGSAPTITGNTIQRGAGGTAGDGGIGGAGGLGGSGGAGGAGVALCSAKGGRGGDGGAGGHGSGGGGACGGSSFGIYTSGIGTPTYCTANTISGGSPGQGGLGGYSGGNSGNNGAAGVLQACTSI